MLRKENKIIIEQKRGFLNRNKEKKKKKKKKKKKIFVGLIKF